MSAGKAMAIILQYTRCNLKSLVPPKTSVTGKYYERVIKSELFPAIKRKRPQFQRPDILLHHDNVPTHSSRVAWDKVKEIGYRAASISAG